MFEYLVGNTIATLIDLSETMPPEDCVVLIHGTYDLPEEHRTKDIPEEYWTGIFYDLAIRSNGEWRFAANNDTINEERITITHWMPMPKAITPE